MLRRLLVFQLLAFWPVWLWYGRRVMDPCDSVLCVVPIVAVMFWLQWAMVEERDCQSFLWPTVFTTLYALAVPLGPPLIKAILAVVALSVTLSLMTRGKVFHWPLTALLLLALPVIPTAQFYFGYPLRASVASMAVPILNGAGFNVARQGTCLVWGKHLVSVDAPCSGVSMLWAGAFLAFCLALFNGLESKGTFLLGLFSFIIILAGNVLRTSSLFIVEHGGLAGTPWLHEGIGVVIFALTALLVALMAKCLAGEKWATEYSC